MDANSRHAGQTIRDLRIRKETGALVVAIRRADGSFTATPSPDTRIDAGTTASMRADRLGIPSADSIESVAA